MTPTILLHNSFCTLEGFSKSTLKDISEMLTYENEEIGQEIIQKWRMRKTAISKKQTKLAGKILGEIKILEKSKIVCLLKGDKFPTGLLNIVKEVLEGTKFQIRDEREKPEAYHEFRWQPDFKNASDFKPRYYQTEMVELALKHGRGVFESCVGSGKTKIMTDIIKALEVNSLIILPSSGLLEQTRRKLVSAFGRRQIGHMTTDAVKKGGKIRPIQLVTIQTLASLNEQKLAGEALEGIDAIFMDEFHHCLSGGASINTDQGIKTIKQIVETKFKGKALSYNIETKVFEFKKIIDWMTFEAPEDLIELEYLGADSRKKTLTCTPSHKIYTENRGYVTAEELTTEDSIVLNSTAVCEICSKEFDSIKSMMDHRGSHKVPKSIKALQAKNMLKSPNWNSKEARKKNSESMKGSKNPAKRPEVRKKKSISQRRWWDSLSPEERVWRTTIFQNAPRQGVRKGPTKLERRIIDLKMKEVAFTGDGKFWLTAEKRNMNPDFKIKNQRKVIEVGDVEYWHTEEDIRERIRLLNSIRFECLYFTNRQLDELDDRQLISQIEEFIRE